MKVMRKILVVVLSVMIGQLTGYAQSVSGKEAKEILMSKVWSVVYVPYIEK